MTASQFINTDLELAIRDRDRHRNLLDFWTNAYQAARMQPWFASWPTAEAEIALHRRGLERCKARVEGLTRPPSVEFSPPLSS